MRMIKMASKRAPQCCVVWNERHAECPLDALMEFKEWTHKQHLNSHITIADMLHVTRNEAKRLLDLAALPDDVTIKRMKELMHK
ncbi:hypothetical protein DW868_00135 [Streptococcus lutetiensis]|nr:hypothetical protein DW868_00135 [Streptococcus lutetiensis]